MLANLKGGYVLILFISVAKLLLILYRKLIVTLSFFYMQSLVT